MSHQIFSSKYLLENKLYAESSTIFWFLCVYEIISIDDWNWFMSRKSSNILLLLLLLLLFFPFLYLVTYFTKVGILLVNCSNDWYWILCQYKWHTTEIHFCQVVVVVVVVFTNWFTYLTVWYVGQPVDMPSVLSSLQTSESAVSGMIVKLYPEHFAVTTYLLIYLLFQCLSRFSVTINPS